LRPLEVLGVAFDLEEAEEREKEGEGERKREKDEK
jgi:hypothetical protein